MAFTSILRGSPAAAGVNLQRAGLALHTIFEHTEEGEPIDLAALLFYLVQEAKIPEGPATEIIVVLKSREPRFTGVTFALPPSCANLTGEQIEAIVQQYTSRGGDKATTYEKKPEDASGQPFPSSAWSPSKKRGGDSKGRALYALLGVSVAGLIGSLAYNAANAPPPLIPIVFPEDPAGLPCAKDGPPMGNGIARCVIPKALFDAEGVEGIKARGQITKRAAKTLGVTKLYVVTKEDWKTRAAL